MNAYRLAAGVVFAAAVTVCLPLPAHAGVDSQSKAVLAASGRALGAQAFSNINSIRTDGTISALGLKGSGTQYAGIASGHFAEFSIIGPYHSDDGFDGKSAWNRDGAGLVSVDGSDAGRSGEINTAFVQTFGLLRRNAGGASVHYAGEKTEKSHTYDVLSVTPAGSKLPFELWIDRATHLPFRTVQPNTRGAVTVTTTLSDYRRVGGMMMPYAVHVDSSDGNNSDVAVTKVSLNPPDAASKLKQPPSSVRDFSISNGATSTTIPVELIENHVYLNVMLNGKGPYRFIFDTGGANVIDPAVAKEIGAFSSGSAQGSGVGEQTEGFSFGTVRELRVGDAVLKDQLFAVAPVRMGFGMSAGQPADGLIGWEVLARYITTFNYSKNTVILTMPSAAKPVEGAHVIPFVLNGTQPQVNCAIDGIPSECTIDTGARDTLSFYVPYIKANPQVVPATLTATGVTGFGFGGAASGKLGRLNSIQLDDLTLSDLVADYSTESAGAMASQFTAANLGGNLLRRFDITFDYYKQTMSLVPNSAFSERDWYDRSGLFLLRKNGQPIIADARPGTPAAEAGLAKGDTIVSIDGTATDTISLDKARSYFLAPAGTVVHVTVTGKDGAQRQVTLTLRDYV